MLFVSTRGQVGKVSSAHAIKEGLAGDGVTEILSGLSAGDQLVVVGKQYLSDGDAVRVVNGG